MGRVGHPATRWPTTAAAQPKNSAKTASGAPRRRSDDRDELRIAPAHAIAARKSRGPGERHEDDECGKDESPVALRQRKDEQKAEWSEREDIRQDPAEHIAAPAGYKREDDERCDRNLSRCRAERDHEASQQRGGDDQHHVGWLARRRSVRSRRNAVARGAAGLYRDECDGAEKECCGDDSDHGFGAK